jgi:hypothetical protein
VSETTQLSLIDDLRIPSWAARDQGEDDACMLYAATALHEIQRRSSNEIPLSEISLTPGAKVPKGGYPLSAVCQSMAQYGQLAKTAYENIPAAQRHRARDRKDLWWMKARLTRVDPDPDNIAAHLEQGSAVLLALRLTRQFRQRDVSIIRASTSDRTIPSRHAVSVVARTDTSSESLFLVRNSWGNRWGQAGYAFLGSDYIKNQGELAAVIDGLIDSTETQ